MPVASKMPHWALGSKAQYSWIPHCLPILPPHTDGAPPAPVELTELTELTDVVTPEPVVVSPPLVVAPPEPVLLAPSSMITPPQAAARMARAVRPANAMGNEARRMKHLRGRS